MNKIFRMLPDENFKELLKGSSIAFLIKVLAAMLGMVLNVLITRSLGIQDSGVYFLALTIITVFVTLSRFGTDSLLVRDISSANAKEDWSRIKGIYYGACILVFGVSVFITFCLFMFSWEISVLFFARPELAEVLKWMSLAIAPVALLSLHASSLQGLKRIRDSNVVVALLTPALMIVGITGMVTAAKDFGVANVAFTYILASFIALVISHKMWVLNYPTIGSSVTKVSICNLMKDAAPLLKISILGIVISSSPMILLGLWGTNSELGAFQVSYRIAILTTFVLTAINSIFAPKLAAHFSLKEGDAVVRLIKQSTILMVGLSLPFTLVCLIWSKEILSVFGDEFRSYSIVLIVLVVGQFLNVASGSVGQILIMSGNQGKLHRAFLSSSLITLSVGAILIKCYGAIGAAISSAVGVVLVNLLAVFFVVRHVDFKMGK